MVHFGYRAGHGHRSKFAPISPCSVTKSKELEETSYNQTWIAKLVSLEYPFTELLIDTIFVVV